MTRKEKFEAAWKKYEAEAEEARGHAIKAKEEYRSSDFDMWMQQYEIAKEKALHFFQEYLNA